MKKSNVSCKICNKTAHGNHFGVDSCRACAAFFRRTAKTTWADEKCQRFRGNRKICFCRPCRVQRCIQMGMKTEKFQLHRDNLSLAPSVSYFVGRPEFLLFCNPSEFPNLKTYINLQNLISEASRLLNLGSETPIIAENTLKRLNLGFKVFEFDKDDMKYFDRIGKIESMDIVEYYFLTVTKWIMHFDEFQKISIDDKMKILKTVWFIWCKLHKCAATVKYRRTLEVEMKQNQKILRNTCIDYETAKFDTSWMSDYPEECVLRYLLSQNLYEVDIMKALEKLDPTDVELTFMFSHICFEYAGKRFQGEILKITDQFQKVLANNLHDYYIKDQRRPRYFHRLNELMKVNNMMQRSFWENRPHRELGRVFNVLKIGFSHPEMFEDSGFY